MQGEWAVLDPKQILTQSREHRYNLCILNKKTTSTFPISRIQLLKKYDHAQYKVKLCDDFC